MGFTNDVSLETVTLLETAGQVEVHLNPNHFEGTFQHDRRSDPIYVVVPVDQDLLVAIASLEDACNHAINTQHEAGIVKIFKAWIEKGSRLFRVGQATVDQDLSQQGLNLQLSAQGINEIRIRLSYIPPYFHWKSLAPRCGHSFPRPIHCRRSLKKRSRASWFSARICLKDTSTDHAKGTIFCSDSRNISSLIE